MSSIHLWYPPFHLDCAQAGRSSAQAIHSHPQVCAQSTAGNFLARPVTWGCPGRTEPRRSHRRPRARTRRAAHSAKSMTAGIEGISALWARRPLCSRADGVAFGAQGWVRGAGAADEAWVAIVLSERHTGRSRLVGAAFALSVVAFGSSSCAGAARPPQHADPAPATRAPLAARAELGAHVSPSSIDLIVSTRQRSESAAEAVCSPDGAGRSQRSGDEPPLTAAPAVPG
jgi:hypothetical protein